ncbi:putative cytochrome aa3 oxidase assembly protein,related to CtaA [Thiobacillus denitrificans ATCC 25259]|uniref:Putative cytochrome aa3 oxidase assembly protein,related to CtaA n=1 Tax=Thiobacillus denitrificans (strain ATCC 25259 / T1) TaxID=292415 RepID=Q3SLW6_THIDA|nr:COX15/CtaA family protein [Thiobacillus denitrificans]AAZ96287.1 putative cytochrome aa3 oxidase assembly protein,related to CtaA [Thiobacillus denitrificans ATCC 25259]
MSAYRNLALLALILTLGVVSLGAFVRLSDAGLGCPDWPGCYGKLTPHHAAEAIDAAIAAQPDGPVTHLKAWKEMVHRYFAGTLGMLVLGLAVLAWRRRRDTRGGPALPLLLLGLIVFQALLGMWTVTQLLKPLVVTAHLLGGMATLSLLLWLWLRERGDASAGDSARVDRLRGSAVLALALVTIQIALGGWVSSNYAALACTDFPLCQGAWAPAMDFAHGFTLQRELGETASGELLPLAALTAIHWTHRVMALIVALYLAWLISRLLRTPGYAGLGIALAALLALQVTLGISNVLLSLPLGLAVAHNTGAALLLAAVVLLNYRLRGK